MKKVKKFILPVLFSLCCLCVSFVLSPSLYDFDIGGIIFVLGFIAVWIFVLIPLHCVLYSRRILLREKRKYLFALYNSFVLTMFYFLPLCTEDETYIYSLILFLWTALWSVLPLMIGRKSKTPTK